MSSESIHDQAVFDAIQAAVAAGEPIGWQVLTPEGEVVDSGAVTFAEMTSETREAFGLEPAQEE